MEIRCEEIGNDGDGNVKGGIQVGFWVFRGGGDDVIEV